MTTFVICEKINNTRSSSSSSRTSTSLPTTATAASRSSGDNTLRSSKVFLQIKHHHLWVITAQEKELDFGWIENGHCHGQEQ
mmetsp:Transcript_8778/g.22069  ORF Transcript_8778/g.22069 Transcript_8778/m.22069 type:complete len:82 (-) Transcript_8778:1200-1445(-)